MSSRPGARPSSGTILLWLVALVVAVLIGAWVVINGQAIIRSFFPPDPATTQGQAIHNLYVIVFTIAAIIFFVVEGLIVWTVIRYRRKPGDDELPPQTHGHNLAEIVWTIVPTLIVIFLFFVSWQTLNTVEASSASPDLKVRAHFEPVPEFVEAYTEVLGARMREDDGLNEQGEFSDLQLFVLLHEYKAQSFGRGPVWLQKPAIPLLAAFGRARGYKGTYPVQG